AVVPFTVWIGTVALRGGYIGGSIGLILLHNMVTKGVFSAILEKLFGISADISVGFYIYNPHFDRIGAFGSAIARPVGRFVDKYVKGPLERYMKRLFKVPQIQAQTQALPSVTGRRKEPREPSGPRIDTKGHGPSPRTYRYRR